MSFIEDIKQRAREDIKTIVLPESNDIRVLKGASQVLQEGYADIILIGNKEEILSLAKENNVDISKAKIVDPLKSTKFSKYSNDFYELRKAKGMTIEKAKEILKDNVYFGMMMVKEQDADGLVSGACHSTADTLRPALQILKTAARNKTGFSIFLNGSSRL